MKNKIFKILWIISLLIPIITFLFVNIIKRKTYQIYNSTNYLGLIIYFILNILFGFLFFKNYKNKIIYILYITFIIFTLCVPIYHNGNMYAPTGPRSNLMGVAFQERYLNVYGINIIRLTSNMPIAIKDF